MSQSQNSQDIQGESTLEATVYKARFQFVN